jgi:hypothetical protein
LSIVYIRLAARRIAPLRRSPLLERLLARADSSALEIDWRAAAFRAIAPGEPAPAPAAVAQYAQLGPIEGAWVFIAAPVHYIAGTSRVQLPPDGLLRLEPPEAQSLAVDFNRQWDGAGVRLMAGRGASLYCIFEKPLRAATQDPEAAIGSDIGEFLPTGPDAPAVRRVMSEIEMWLFEHAVNRVREARSAAAVSGLWLWGGGAVSSALPAVQGWTAGEDALFGAFGARTNLPRGAGSGVVVLRERPGSEEWRDAESRWIRPALAELRAGGIAQVMLSAADRCHRVSARGSFRFWRRTRPWWESFGDND